MTTSTNPFELAAQKLAPSGAKIYAYDPVGFVREFVDAEPAPYQEASLRDLCEHRRLAVRAPHGTGKTMTAALVILWFIITREAMKVDWKVVTTAGAWRQLEKYLWPEIHKWVSFVEWDDLKIPKPKKGKDLLDLAFKGQKGEAFAVASSDPQLVEGAHADSLLVVFDESKAIAAGVFDAIEGAFSGADMSGIQGRLPEAFALAISTPGATSGRFYEIHQRRPGLQDWHTRHITLAEAIAAGRITQDWADKRAQQWGADSALYANRVLGEFHSGAEQSILPLAWIEAAIERWHVWKDAGGILPPGTKVFGLDVALGGADLSCLATRQAHVVASFETANINDTTKVAKWAASKMLNQTDMINVDVIGVGAGVGDLLALPIDAVPISGYGKHVIRYKSSRKSTRRDRSGLMEFVNQRAALWWAMRETLDPAFEPTLCLPPDDDLIGELAAPIWWETPAGKIAVELKKDVIERIGRSTDRADAVLQTLATDSEWDSTKGNDEPVNVPFENEPTPDDEDYGVFAYE